MTRTPIALVTGASRGIGAAVALRLAREGATVVLGARTLPDCRAVAARIEAAGGRATAVALDVTDEASVRAAVACAEELGGGRIDWLVNNAGIAESGPLLPRPNKPGQNHARHLDVNLHGPRRMVEAAAPAMLAAAAGAVVNVASSAALRGYAYVAAYCASKHALLGYARSAALETGARGLRWFAICPHYVDSPMLTASVERVVQTTGKGHEEVRRHFAEQNPSGRLVTPEDVADVVADACAGRRAPGVIELDGASAHTLETWS